MTDTPERIWFEFDPNQFDKFGFANEDKEKLCEPLTEYVHIDLYEAQAARIEELEAANEWQPIETAPKDGTPVLGYSPKFVDPDYVEDEEYFVMLWAMDYSIVKPRGKRAQEKAKCWILPHTEQDEQGGWHTVTPTHWKPLPNPPAKETP